MAHVLMGTPKTVVNYPKATKNFIGNRSKETRIAYNTGIDIIKKYETKAGYWAEKVPFISLKYAIEGRNAAAKVHDKYADNDTEKVEVQTLGKRLLLLSARQAELALAVPTQDIVKFVSANQSVLYRDMTLRNQKVLEMHQIEEMLKIDAGKKLVADLNGVALRFHEALQTGAYERKKEIAFYDVTQESYVVRAESNIKPGELKEIANDMAKIGDNYTQKLAQGIGQCETGDEYRAKLNTAMGAQAGNFAQIGKIVEIMKQEFGDFYKGVMSSVALSPGVQLALGEIASAIDGLGAKAWAKVVDEKQLAD